MLAKRCACARAMTGRVVCAESEHEPEHEYGRIGRVGLRQSPRRSAQAGLSLGSASDRRRPRRRGVSSLDAHAHAFLCLSGGASFFEAFFLYLAFGVRVRADVAPWLFFFLICVVAAGTGVLLLGFGLRRRRVLSLAAWAL